MGLTKVKQFDDPFTVSEAVKQNLAKTLLAGGFDLSTARLAGCIVVGGKKLLAQAKGLQSNIDYARLLSIEGYTKTIGIASGFTR